MSQITIMQITLKYSNNVIKGVFRTREEADKALAELEPYIGKERFSYNKIDETSPVSFRIKTEDGDCVVSISEISSASVCVVSSPLAVELAKINAKGYRMIKDIEEGKTP